MMRILWIGAMVAFILAELATQGLVSVWFVFGAIGALLSTLAGVPPLGQLGVFVFVSGACLALTRPLVRRFTSGKAVRTNADRIIGGAARVTEPVDAEHGAVSIDGKIWTARTEEGEPIPAEERVYVERIEGVKVYVRRSRPPVTI